MHPIEMHQPSREFLECWSAAGRHLQTRGESAVNWLKADPRPPFLEHLSFRLGNQLFFVRIEDADGKLDVPGNPKGFLTVSDGCRGHGCLMPMRRIGGGWRPVAPGWGLVDGRTSVLVRGAAVLWAGGGEALDAHALDLSAGTRRLLQGRLTLEPASPTIAAWPFMAEDHACDSDRLG